MHNSNRGHLFLFFDYLIQFACTFHKLVCVTETQFSAELLFLTCLAGKGYKPNTQFLARFNVNKHAKRGKRLGTKLRQRQQYCRQNIALLFLVT